MRCVYDVQKTRTHEDDGADAAGGTWISLLLTCIPGYQMSRMQLAYESQMRRAVQTR